MGGKILAAVLLIFGGGATLYILYKVVIGIIQPVLPKKLKPQMQKGSTNNLQNNLQLHKQQGNSNNQDTQNK